MIIRPKFKAKYHIENLGAEGVFLLSENEKHVLEGEDLLNVVPHVNGKNTWEEIVTLLAPKQQKEKTIQALGILYNNGHVMENTNGISTSEEIFWGEMGRNSHEIRQLQQSINIQVKFIGPVDPQPFEEALTSFGFTVDDSQPASFVLVVADDYQYDVLESVNEACLASGTPWMMVKPCGLNPLLGPIFVPGKTACWKCLESRLVHNREVESFIARKKNHKGPFPLPKSRLKLAETRMISDAVIQMMKYIVTGSNPELESRIMSADMLQLGSQFHAVTRRPQCPTCGDPAMDQVSGKPIRFESKLGNSHTGNGMRLESPEATFYRYQNHISPLTGIVNAVLPTPWHGVGPIRVYSAGHNFALKNDELYFLKDGLRTNSSGKGRTDAQAKTSALCEALERYAGVYRDSETKIRSSYKELGSQAIHLHDLMYFSDEQYAKREEWLRKGRFQVVPNRFDETAEISWTPVWSHTEQKVKYVPTSYLFYGFRDSEKDFYCWGDSNGNAAGSSIEDAALQGFLELVERDSVALWWYNRVQRPQVDLASLEDPFVNSLISFYEEQGREFWVLDLTADTGIPAFAAINRRTDHAKEDIIMGFGAHLDARIAINRAITEMNQFIPAVLSKAENGDSIISFNDPAALEWWDTATVENQTYLVPLAGPKISIGDLPRNESPDILASLEACFKTVEDMGLEVLIMDQTRPDVGLPVVKVMVPGLRHFWARFGKGRLYDVPVKLGWLKKAKKESELNPIPMFV